MFNLNDLNVTGGEVLTGKRAMVTDPDKDVRTTPTKGKISISSAFEKLSGFTGGTRVVFLDMPKQIQGVNIQYPFATTHKERDTALYAITAGINGEEGLGNIIAGGRGASSFGSQSSWNCLQGTEAGSQYYRSVKVYGVAIEVQNDTISACIAVTPDNLEALQANENIAGVMVAVPDQDQATVNFRPVENLDAALQSNPCYVLEFTSYKEKSEKGGSDDSGTTEVVASNNTQVEDQSFDEVVETENADFEFQG